MHGGVTDESLAPACRPLQAYQRTIQRAVAERKARDGEVHALDMGAGTGVLAMLAAQAGASSVVACDLHESLCDVARKASAAASCPACISSPSPCHTLWNRDIKGGKTLLSLQR